MDWHIAKQAVCPLTGREVFLLEKRAHASRKADGTPHVVEARRCSRDLECNGISGIYCKWAFTSPDVDPFEEEEIVELMAR